MLAALARKRTQRNRRPQRGRKMLRPAAVSTMHFATPRATNDELSR
jgi:hypothetical protein